MDIPEDLKALVDVDEQRAQLMADWAAAVRSQTPQGDCPHADCPGKLRATPAIITASVLWLEAECDENPRHQVALPNGRRATPASRRPGALAEVHRVGLRVDGPDWRERAVGPDY